MIAGVETTPSGKLEEAQARKRIGLVQRLDRVHTWDHGKLPRR
jgi:hypothetical protein